MSGDLAAIVCAAFFAFCSIAFAAAGRQVGSMVVNQLRILLAVLFLFGLHRASQGEFWPGAIRDEQLVFLLVSGVVGLSLGDLFYFHALTVLGPRIGTLLMATFPAFVVLGEGYTRQHWPDGWACLWMAVIVGGVMLVLTGRRAPAGAWKSASGNRFWAVCCGLLGALGQGAGIVLAKLAADASPAGGTDTLSVTVVRMTAGCAGMVAIAGLAAVGSRGQPKARAMTPRAFWLIVIGVVFGPTLGVWLSMEAIDLIPAGRASALIGLTPVMMLPIGWVGWKERPTPRAIAGTLLAFGGAAALLFRAAS